MTTVQPLVFCLCAALPMQLAAQPWGTETPNEDRLSFLFSVLVGIESASGPNGSDERVQARRTALGSSAVYRLRNRHLAVGGFAEIGLSRAPSFVDGQVGSLGYAWTGPQVGLEGEKRRGGFLLLRGGPGLFESTLLLGVGLRAGYQASVGRERVLRIGVEFSGFVGPETAEPGAGSYVPSRVGASLVIEVGR